MMHAQSYVLQALKYATLTLGAVVGFLIVLALFRGADSGDLAGRLVSTETQGVIPTVKFDQSRAIEGFSAPANAHVIFTVPSGVRIQRSTFLGGPEFDDKRYWGYCFSGNEVQNKENGLRGKQIYDGKFFYSLGERKAQSERPPAAADNDLIGILNADDQGAPRAPASIAEILYGDQTCYVMSEVILPVGIDSDGDNLNNELERELGTDPNGPDTDRDGIPDGTEVFTTKTQPTQYDSDRDGLPDRCEDANMNGQADTDETSALNADTDRDGLCDGNGSGTACPEPKQTLCLPGPGTDIECDTRPSSPVFGEDMNQNCKVDKDETDPKNPETFGLPDWDYKWNKFQSQSVRR